MLCGQYPTKSEGKELKIMVQPETQHRARYLTEGSRGSVKDRTQQGFPTVKVGWGQGPGLPQGQGSFTAVGLWSLQCWGSSFALSVLHRVSSCRSPVLMAAQSYRGREAACQGRDIKSGMHVLLGCSSMDSVNTETFHTSRSRIVKCSSCLMAGDSGPSLCSDSKDIKPGFI